MKHFWRVPIHPPQGGGKGVRGRGGGDRGAKAPSRLTQRDSVSVLLVVHVVGVSIIVLWGDDEPLRSL